MRLWSGWKLILEGKMQLLKAMILYTGLVLHPNMHQSLCNRESMCALLGVTMGETSTRHIIQTEETCQERLPRCVFIHNG